MFSNLKVDGTHNNHWFMPSSFQVADYQNDRVTILSSSHPYLKQFVEFDEQIPYFKLRNFLYHNQDQEITLTYLRNGEQLSIRLPENDGNLEAPSWIARKLLVFRGIPREGPTPCQW